jgi:hypothetical protein
MEASFPDRNNVLRKYSLIGLLIVIFLVLATIGCEPRQNYSVDPVPVFSRVLQIDSSYTTVSVISTGNSGSLFCGKKGIFDSYSLLKFESIPENFDSIFLRFKSAPFSCDLTFFALDTMWYEDSVYEWEDIGSFFDTLNPIQVATILPFASPSDTNPLIFLGDTVSLDSSTISAIGNFGLAVYSDRFYSFEAGETRLKIRLNDTLSDTLNDTLSDTLFSIRCTEDAYLVKNPFQDSIIFDSLLVGRGLSIRTHIFIPQDSLPLYLNSVAKAEIILDVDSRFSFPVRGSVEGVPGYHLGEYTEDNDSLRYEDMAMLFQLAEIDSVMHVQLRALSETDGIDVRKLGGGMIRFVWVELPR